MNKFEDKRRALIAGWILFPSSLMLWTWAGAKLIIEKDWNWFTGSALVFFAGLALLHPSVGRWWRHIRDLDETGNPKPRHKQGPIDPYVKCEYRRPDGSVFGVSNNGGRQYRSDDIKGG